MKNQIEIIDWAGNVLFKGSYKSKEVDRVLSVNRCKVCKDWSNHGVIDNPDECQACDNTGYKGDFEVYWVDGSRTDNVYEFINY